MKLCPLVHWALFQVVGITIILIVSHFMCFFCLVQTPQKNLNESHCTGSIHESEMKTPQYTEKNFKPQAKRTYMDLSRKSEEFLTHYTLILCTGIANSSCFPGLSFQNSHTPHLSTHDMFPTDLTKRVPSEHAQMDCSNKRRVAGRISHSCGMRCGRRIPCTVKHCNTHSIHSHIIKVLPARSL